MFKVNLDKAFIEETYFLRKKKIRFSEIKSVQVRQVTSLVNEIGIIICADSGKTITIRDSDLNFEIFVSLFELGHVLGSDWYREVEQGRVFTISREKIEAKLIDRE